MPNIDDRLRELASLAEECLALSNSLLRSRVRRQVREGCGVCRWNLCLDDPPSSSTIEACAVSIGGLALMESGERPDSDIIRGAADLVAQLQGKDGGWTSFTPSTDEESLTVEAFFAIPFLLAVDRDQYEGVARAGVDWLVSVEAPQGGWGFYAGDEAHVLTTSYGLRVMAQWIRAAGVGIHCRDLVGRGVNRLAAWQRESGAWAADENQPDSAVQTAVALLGLTAGGRPGQHSAVILRGQNWLLSNPRNREGVVVEYPVPQRDAANQIIGIHRRISHVTFPEGVIVQALLKSGVDILDERLLSEVTGLCNAQSHDGSWESHSFVHGRPIYAILDACSALNRFASEVADRKDFLQARAEVLALRDQIAVGVEEREALSEKIQQLGENAKSLTNTISDLGARADSMQAILRRVENLLFGLYWLRPAVAVASAARRFPLLAALVLVIAAYALARVLFTATEGWLGLGVALLSAMLLAIQIVVYYRGKER